MGYQRPKPAVAAGGPTAAGRAELRQNDGAQRFVLPEFGHAARRKRMNRRLVVAAVIAADLATILAVITLVGFGYLPLDRAMDQVPDFASIIVPLYAVAALNNGAFQILADETRVVPLWKAMTAFAFSAAGVMLVVFLAKVGEDFSRVLLLGSIALSLAALTVGRHLMDRWAKSFLGRQPFAALHIYDDISLPPAGEETAVSIGQLGIRADASDPEMIARLAELAHGCDRLLIHCGPQSRPNWAFVLRSLNLPAEIAVPEILELGPISIHRRAGKISLLIATGPLMWHQRIVKRGFDLVVTLAALPFALLVIGLLAIAIRLDSRGPVFFVQKRIGLNNRPFEIYKLRSMRVDRLDFDGARLTDRHDPRLTRLGGFLRRTSLDELPQIFNVLLGDMSIVGPRPHVWNARAGEALYWEVDSAYWHRHVVKPGITGLAQVRGHRGNTFHEDHLRRRLDSDLEYVANWSLANDIRIIFKTFGALRHENAF